MTTAHIIIFLLACFGFQIGIAYGKMPIIKYFREKLIKNSEFFKDMFECPLCLGFWTSLLLTILYYKFSIILLMPLAGGGFCLLVKWTFDYISDFVEKK
jgi:hypothetical protein